MINIDIISYLVVKNVILRFRPCWVYPVGLLSRCHGNVSVEFVSVGQMLYQPVGGDLYVKCGPGKKNCTDAMVATTATTAGIILV